MDEEENSSEKSGWEKKDLDNMVKCMAMWMSQRYFASLLPDQEQPVDEEGKIVLEQF